MALRVERSTRLAVWSNWLATKSKPVGPGAGAEGKGANRRERAARNARVTSNFMKNLDGNGTAARSIPPRAVAVLRSAVIRPKPGKDGTNDGKQLPSVGTGRKKPKTTSNRGTETTIILHIEYSARDNRRNAYDCPYS